MKNFPLSKQVEIRRYNVKAVSENFLIHFLNDYVFFQQCAKLHCHAQVQHP